MHILTHSLIMRVSACVLLFVCAPWIAVAQTTWEWRNPLPHGNTVLALQFTDSVTAIEAGMGGVVLRTTDDGAHWSQIATGVRTDLFGLSFDGGAHGVAVGDSGISLWTADSGKSWSRSGTPHDGWLRSVWLRADTAIAVGSDGAIYRTTNGGDEWASVLSGTIEELTCVKFNEAGRGVIVGAHGTLLRSANRGVSWTAASVPTERDLLSAWLYGDTLVVVGASGTIYRSEDGGDHWINRTLATASAFSGVDFADGQTGIIVGWYGLLAYTTDGGAHWGATLVGGETQPWTVAFSTKRKALAVGFSGLAYATTDAGQNWAQRYSGSTTPLSAVSFHGSQYGVAVGGNAGAQPTILFTTDGGHAWNRNVPLLTFAETKSAAMLTSATCVVGLSNGSVLRTTNRGSSWQESSVAGWGGNDLAFADDSVGFLVAEEGSIFRTSDAGATWVEQNPGVTSSFGSVAVFGRDRAYVIGIGGNVRTTDGGVTWTPWTGGFGGVLRGICFADSLNMFGVGADSVGPVVLHSSDGGESWSMTASPEHEYLYTVSFLDAEHGLAAGYRGVVFRTTDAGAHWTRLETGSPNTLRDIACIDAQTAVVVGDNGTILQTSNAMLTDVKDGPVALGVLPAAFRLQQNYPNPFNPVTWIRYSLPVASPVTLRIYNVLGEQVRELVDDLEEPGDKVVQFDAGGLPSGVYYYRLRAGAAEETRKLMLLR